MDASPLVYDWRRSFVADPLRVQMSGPLSAFADGYREELLARGYGADGATKQLQLMAHLSRWIRARGLVPGALGGWEIERFVAERRSSHRDLVSVWALEPLLGYLCGLGVVPLAGSREAPTPAGELLNRYSDYLRVRRGVKASTIRNYCNHARDFLTDREQRFGGPALETLDVAAINDWMLRESRRLSVSSTGAAAGALRSFLRFLHVDGVIDRDLAVAVPMVARWRLASLVRAVDPLLLTRLLSACDRATVMGRRDFAIITLLSRLGLRIAEVATLRLEDIDWHAGELVIHGKSQRRERLPLPVDVGEAIVDWLRHGRPGCASRVVFTRLRAPHAGLQPASLNGIVHRACERAEVPAITAHQLRHTAATEMLRAGAGLREVGQVLRHRGSEVTSIYAKVDRRALAALVQPWPGAAA
jgi:integrase/recombinase XerD